MTLVKKTKDPKIEAGDTFTFPKGMTLKDAVDALMRKMKEEDEIVAIHETIDAYPLDGAYCFMQVMKDTFGWAQAVPTPGFFGANPPTLVDLEVDHGVHAQVIWGSFMVPGMENATLQTSGRIGPDGRPQFVISGKCKQKYRPSVFDLARRTREYVRMHSVYKGKAIRLTTDDDGDLDLETNPKFLDLSRVNPDELTFSDSVARQVETTLFTPIKRTDLCRKNKIPLKRGVLLEGPYGCGKTLTAYVTADLCKKNGWTFIYLDRVAGLKAAIRLASLYGPAVIFAEDIDRVVAGDRSVKIDDILNQIDGIEAKSQECIVILTTNYVDKIEKAMLRPGRLDSVITVSPPDAIAAQRLIRIYARNLIDPSTDLSDAGRELAGQIPAVIREVVERAKLYAISRLADDSVPFSLTSEDITGAATNMKRHLELMAPAKTPELSEEAQVGASLAKIVDTRLLTHFNGQLTKRLDAIQEALS